MWWNVRFSSWMCSWQMCDTVMSIWTKMFQESFQHLEWNGWWVYVCAFVELKSFDPFKIGKLKSSYFKWAVSYVSTDQQCGAIFCCISVIMESFCFSVNALQSPKLSKSMFKYYISWFHWFACSRPEPVLFGVRLNLSADDRWHMKKLTPSAKMLCVRLRAGVMACITVY